MIRAPLATAILLLVLWSAGASNGLAISPPSEIVTDPSATQLTTLVPNAQNLQQSDILAVLSEEAAQIAREITTETEPGPADEPGGAVPLRRREEARRLTVRAIAATETGGSAPTALALTQMRERLADVHLALAGDATFSVRPEAAGILAALKDGVEGPILKVLDASRTLVVLVRTPGAVAADLRAKIDETLAALYPLVRSIETQIAEGTN